jgi:hypothetical protein
MHGRRLAPPLLLLPYHSVADQAGMPLSDILPISTVSGDTSSFSYTLDYLVIIRVKRPAIGKDNLTWSSFQNLRHFFSTVALWLSRG